jgi:hypothetical protein
MRRAQAQIHHHALAARVPLGYLVSGVLALPLVIALS